MICSRFYLIVLMSIQTLSVLAKDIDARSHEKTLTEAEAKLDLFLTWADDAGPKIADLHRCADTLTVLGEDVRFAIDQLTEKGNGRPLFVNTSTVLYSPESQFKQSQLNFSLYENFSTVISQQKQLLVRMQAFAEPDPSRHASAEEMQIKVNAEHWQILEASSSINTKEEQILRLIGAYQEL